MFAEDNLLIEEPTVEDEIIDTQEEVVAPEEEVVAPEEDLVDVPDEETSLIIDEDIDLDESPEELDDANYLTDDSDVDADLAEEEEEEESEEGTLLAEEEEDETEAEAKASGMCGETAAWTVSADGEVLTISGTGAIFDYSLETVAPWAQEAATLKAVVIESGITEVGTYAFNGLTEVTSVTLADTVSAIGTGAFRDMSALAEISVLAGNGSFATADGVLFTADGARLVAYPQSLAASEYDVPASVTTVDAYAFYGQDFLQKLVLPASVTEIGDNAFAECTVLADITLA